MIERIAILGTGLLGTSVGLALRAANFAEPLSAGTAIRSMRRLRSDGRTRLGRRRPH